GSGHHGAEVVGFLTAVRAGAEVHVVAAQHHTGELGPGVGVLHGQPPTGQGAHGLAHQVPGGQVHRLGPAGGHQFTGLLVPHQGGVEHVRCVLPGVGEAVLIGDPLFVHGGVVTGQAAHYDAPAVVHPDGGTACVVFGDGGAGHQVEGAGAEPVGGRGQCPHRADLDRVAGEVGGEGAPGGVLVGRGHGPGAAFGGRDQGGLTVRAHH